MFCSGTYTGKKTERWSDFSSHSLGPRSGIHSDKICHLLHMSNNAALAVISTAASGKGERARGRMQRVFLWAGLGVVYITSVHITLPGIVHSLATVTARKSGKCSLQVHPGR